MKGHIYLETFADQPERVRILSQETDPRSESVSSGLRYVAHFANAHIAYMHVHNTLKRKLENIDTRIYKVSLTEAIAAIEAEDLKHERIWIDPVISTTELQAISTHTQQFQKKQLRTHRLYLIAGGVGVLLLLFILLGGIWNA